MTQWEIKGKIEWSNCYVYRFSLKDKWILATLRSPLKGKDKTTAFINFQNSRNKLFLCELECSATAQVPFLIVPFI